MVILKHITCYTFKNSLYMLHPPSLLWRTLRTHITGSPPLLDFCFQIGICITQDKTMINSMSTAYQSVFSLILTHRFIFIRYEDCMHFVQWTHLLSLDMFTQFPHILFTVEENSFKKKKRRHRCKCMFLKVSRVSGNFDNDHISRFYF